MNVICIAAGEYDGFPYCVKAAQVRSGCNVTVVECGTNHFSNSIKLNAGNTWRLVETARKLFSRLKPMTAELNTMSQFRWVAAAHVIDKLELEGPYFIPDWDVVVFSDLNQACAELVKLPVSVSMECDTARSAAYIVNNFKTLKQYCEFMNHAIENVPYGQAQDSYNDMGLWVHFIDRERLPFGNVASIVNNGAFDHNIHCGKGKYVFDGETKRIIWSNKNPYFQLLDGTLIKAHSIHCWGNYKHREHELCVKAGIL